MSIFLVYVLVYFYSTFELLLAVILLIEFSIYFLADFDSNDFFDFKVKIGARLI